MKALLHYDADLERQQRFQRVKVVLSGRYMLESKEEFNCKTIEMSPGDIVLAGPGIPSRGEKVIVYLDDLGRFAGVAGQLTESGFVLNTDLPLAKRDKLADQLIWFANRHVVGLPEDRRHERIVPLMQRALMRLEDKSESIIKILDISLSGVGVETSNPPPVGARVTIGSTPTVVIRHFAGGFAGQFPRPLPADAVNESMRL